MLHAAHGRARNVMAPIQRVGQENRAGRNIAVTRHVVHHVTMSHICNFLISETVFIGGICPPPTLRSSVINS